MSFATTAVKSFIIFALSFNFALANTAIHLKSDGHLDTEVSTSDFVQAEETLKSILSAMTVLDGVNVEMEDGSVKPITSFDLRLDKIKKVIWGNKVARTTYQAGSFIKKKITKAVPYLKHGLLKSSSSRKVYSEKEYRSKVEELNDTLYNTEHNVERVLAPIYFGLGVILFVALTASFLSELGMFSKLLEGMLGGLFVGKSMEYLFKRGTSDLAIATRTLPYMLKRKIFTKLNKKEEIQALKKYKFSMLAKYCQVELNKLNKLAQSKEAQIKYAPGNMMMAIVPWVELEGFTSNLKQVNGTDVTYTFNSSDLRQEKAFLSLVSNEASDDFGHAMRIIEDQTHTECVRDMTLILTSSSKNKDYMKHLGDAKNICAERKKFTQCRQNILDLTVNN